MDPGTSNKLQFKAFNEQVAYYCSQSDGDQLAQLFRAVVYGWMQLTDWREITDTNIYGDQSIEQQLVKLVNALRVLIKETKKPKDKFAQQGRVIAAAGFVAAEVKFQGHIWICKTLRIVLRHSKHLLMRCVVDDRSVPKLITELKNYFGPFRAPGRLSDEAKRQILPLMDNMEVSIMLSVHDFNAARAVIYAPKKYGEVIAKFKANNLFHKGKYSLMTEGILAAEESFEAIEAITSSQQRLVLKYLIPCKLFLGEVFVPRENRAEELFPEYSSLSAAISKASFSQFDRVSIRYQRIWIKRSLYLLIDKLRILIWRNLLQGLYKIFGEKVEFSHIMAAVKLAGGSECLEECICIVSNLIYEGYCKGYIFQNDRLQVLVLKKERAFPPIRSVRKD